MVKYEMAREQATRIMRGGAYERCVVGTRKWSLLVYLPDGTKSSTPTVYMHTACIPQTHTHTHTEKNLLQHMCIGIHTGCIT